MVLGLQRYEFDLLALRILILVGQIDHIFMKSPRSPEEFFAAQSNWKGGILALRKILLSTELEEELKWGMPVYTLNKKNVAGIGSFKEYFGIWFYQGVFLKDPADVLINAQKGTTKGLRQWRFRSLDEIDETLIRSYIMEAIENQKAGKEIKAEKKKVGMPDELSEALKSDAALEKAFQNFTPARQHEFMEHIGSAARTATRLRRLEKVLPLIKRGEGLNDRYK